MPMVVVLLDEPAETSKIEQLDRVASLRIQGRSLEMTGLKRPLVYERGAWHSPTRSYSVISIETPVHVHFEDRQGHSKRFGPFEGLRVVDGAIRPGNNPQHVLAWLEQEHWVWHIHGDPIRWQSVIFIDAKPPA
ncbi:MAG: hypothetical protein WD847_09370 [Pirellulales bacterium]